MRRLKILLVSSEAAPFAKTGGIADVVSSLPKALKALGHDARVVIPKYRTVEKEGFNLYPLSLRFKVNMFKELKEVSLSSSLISEEIPIYFIENKDYFDRDNLYGTIDGEYLDNAERFVFFSKAVLEMLREIDFKPDIIHCNDWQTGLVPACLKTLYKQNPFYSSIASIFTIHNLFAQGVFDREVLEITGLPKEVCDKIEFKGRVNFMKAGITFAELINTVSDKYSQEIQSPEFGCGLDGVLRNRHKDLYGVLNGVDYDVWNPAKDKFIIANYNVNDLAGKKKCKIDLLCEYKLKVESDVPIMGVVSRLIEQKGFDIVIEIIDQILSLDLYFVLLGTGEIRYQKILEEVGRRYPEKAGIKIEFNSSLSHKIIAGSDIFLMPSREEPCGLNQLYSLKYGTIPIVRATGGLDDTIQDFNPTTCSGNGFKFVDYSSEALFSEIKKALELYNNMKLWKKLMLNAMKCNYSWEKSAKKYIELYKKTMGKLISNPRS